MLAVPQVVIDLAIDREEYLKYYYAPRAIVTARSVDGQRVQFPASILRPYVEHHGISGVFRIEFSSAGKYQSIQRLQ